MNCECGHEKRIHPRGNCMFNGCLCSEYRELRRKMIRILFILGFVLVLTIAAAAQCPAVMPAGTLCITQAAGNQAASNTRELAAQKDKVAALTAESKAKDLSIDELKETNKKNVADLTKENTKLLVENAEKTGENIRLEAENTRLLTLVDVLMKYTRKKCMPLSVCF